MTTNICPLVECVPFFLMQQQPQNRLSKTFSFELVAVQFNVAWIIARLSGEEKKVKRRRWIILCHPSNTVWIEDRIGKRFHPTEAHTTISPGCAHQTPVSEMNSGSMTTPDNVIEKRHPTRFLSPSIYKSLILILIWLFFFIWMEIYPLTDTPGSAKRRMTDLVIAVSNSLSKWIE